MNLHELENAADIVCGECVCIDEDTCSTCPVRLTLDRKRGAYYDVVVSVYRAEGGRIDSQLISGGMESLREARTQRAAMLAVVECKPGAAIEIEVHDRTGALLEIIP